MRCKRANWINLPALSRCDAWNLNVQMDAKEFQSLMIWCFVLAFLPPPRLPLLWWRFQKNGHKEEERHRVTRQHGGSGHGVARSVLQPPGRGRWPAAKSWNRIRRWVEHIKVISDHVENCEGHTCTQGLCPCGQVWEAVRPGMFEEWRISGRGVPFCWARF